MPPINEDFDGIKHKLLKLGRRGWKGIEATLTQSVQHHLLHFSVLNKKEVRMKLNERVVIKSKTMNRDKIFMCG
jgi:hypothetical protein